MGDLLTAFPDTIVPTAQEHNLGSYYGVVAESTALAPTGGNNHHGCPPV